MIFKLGAKSLRKLQGVHPSLVAVVKRAIKITTQDFQVFDGVRTIEEQRELYAQGRTKPGKVVTWTMKSKHLGGRAVDLVVYSGGPRWEPIAGFKKIAAAMKQASDELGVPIEWGGDWAKTRDYPHFQLPDGWEPKRAPAPKPSEKPVQPVPKPPAAGGPAPEPPKPTPTPPERPVAKPAGIAGLILIVLAALAAVVSKVMGIW